MSTYILTVNVGSSSLKLNVFDESIETSIAQISITNIAQTAAHFKTTIHGSTSEYDHPIPSHSQAVEAALEALTPVTGNGEIAAVAVRVVHGGEKYHAPCMIDDNVLKELRELEALDPEHTPTTLHVIDLLTRHLPDVPQVACFDTGFFHDIPLVASTIPLPREYRQKGLKRYGFHGLSYEYVLGAFRDVAGDQAAHGRVIIAHLGSGASLAALKDGRPIDMTMGLSPVSGIPMSTRSGDIDPSVVTHLSRLGVGVDEYARIINKESGLLGVSGISADMKELIHLEETRPEAREAVELFCYSVRKSIGALSAALGGLDSLIFTGGIGEPSALIRRRVCDGLQYLGIELDLDHNNNHEERVSSEMSRVGVHVIPTDESRTLYQGASRVMKKQ